MNQMNYFKISSDQQLVPIENIKDLVSTDGRRMYYVIPDVKDIEYHYPNTDKDIQSITLTRTPTMGKIEVRPSVGYKIKNIDIKRYSPNHLELVRDYHNEAAVAKLMQKVSVDSFLSAPDDSIYRVKTADNRLYVLYQGSLFLVGCTLRLSKVFGTIPNNKIDEVQMGEYDSKNLKFTYEKLSCPKKDLTFKCQD